MSELLDRIESDNKKIELDVLKKYDDDKYRFNRNSIVMLLQLQSTVALLVTMVDQLIDVANKNK